MKVLINQQEQSQKLTTLDLVSWEDDWKRSYWLFICTVATAVNVWSTSYAPTLNDLQRLWWNREKYGPRTRLNEWINNKWCCLWSQLALEWTLPKVTLESQGALWKLFRLPSSWFSSWHSQCKEKDTAKHNGCLLICSLCVVWYHWKSSSHTPSRRTFHSDNWNLLTFCGKYASYETVPKWCALLALTLAMQPLCCQFWHICNVCNLKVFKYFFLINTFLDKKYVYVLRCHSA